MTTHLSSTLTAAFAVDAKQRITEWNESASRLLGRSVAPAPGSPCWKVLQGRDSAGNRYCGRACMLCRMALAGEPIGAEVLSVRQAGGDWLRCKVATLIDDSQSEFRIIHLLEPWSRHDSAASRRRVADTRLTARELETLCWLNRGKSTAEIAGILSVAPSTVRTHVEHLLGKLGAHSRLSAVAEGRRLGLLSRLD